MDQNSDFGWKSDYLIYFRVIFGGHETLVPLVGFPRRDAGASINIHLLKYLSPPEHGLNSAV